MPDNEKDAPESTQSDETPQGEVTPPETTTDAAEGDSEPLEFPRRVVDELRSEAKNLRERTKTAEADREQLAKRLHIELVRASGKLADPEDLDYDPEHLTDPEKLTAAIDALISRKPHLKSRRPQGSISQGVQQDSPDHDLGTILRGFVR
ncbi:hypothetical protein [Mycolicibacterium pulveris]|uniref:hypothetical protein n=1 Tax=Mycolicibacterium pulveris TaxID=36813 RepID=UPI003CEF543F